MGDISRDSPLQHAYDHTDASLTPAPAPGYIDRAIDAAKSYLGIGTPKPDGAKRITPDGPKTPQQIADEQS